MLTAREAVNASPAAARVLDLGCGIGSVLLMEADRLPDARLVGVEAQDVSFALVQRNVARNDLGPRVTLLQGDLRDAEVQQAAARAGGPFDLVSGTPPYMPPGTSTPSPHPQRAHARVELRGGVEDYLRAARELVSDTGHVVVCCDARRPERALDTGRTLGLHPLRHLDAVPRAGRDPLFAVFTFAAAGGETPLVHERFVARDADGIRTDDYFALRTFFGLPPQHRPERARE
ncbi:MAG: SAM-dependent methyltransferase [Sandaracinus sp.]|nr:SAM-dependent methyltransferase [Sandaracinus sp.]